MATEVDRHSASKQTGKKYVQVVSRRQRLEREERRDIEEGRGGDTQREGRGEGGREREREVGERE